MGRLCFFNVGIPYMQKSYFVLLIWFRFLSTLKPTHISFARWTCAGSGGSRGWWRMVKRSVKVAGIFLPVNYSNNFCLRFISKLKPIFGRGMRGMGWRGRRGYGYFPHKNTLIYFNIFMIMIPEVWVHLSDPFVHWPQEMGDFNQSSHKYLLKKSECHVLKTTAYLTGQGYI